MPLSPSVAFLDPHVPSGNQSISRRATTGWFVPTLLAICVLCSGCFSTHLGEYQTPAELENLVQSTPHKIALRVSNPHADSSQGHQFLLFILPVTRVFPGNLDALVGSKLSMYAGFGGHGLIPPGTASQQIPRLDVEVESLSINGYDLVVTRRPSATLSLRGTLYAPDGQRRECQAMGRFSEFSRFAFADDLQRALENATDAGARDLLECLGLFSAREFKTTHGVDIL